MPTDCPQDCPCQLPKPGFRSQQQPTRSIEELAETLAFARKNEDGREADRRLANRRLQPLGHLTAARFLSIRRCWSYANPNSDGLSLKFLSLPAAAITGGGVRLQRLLEGREKVAVLS